MEKLTLLLKSQTSTIQFLFISWVFLLMLLKMTEKIVYLVLHSRDRVFWKNHSALSTVFILLLKLGALIGAVIFVSGVLFLMLN